MRLNGRGHDSVDQGINVTAYPGAVARAVRRGGRRHPGRRIVHAIVLVSARAGAPEDGWGSGRTRTPIKHLVVIFQENASFDHYFGTYPRAANPPGEPRFVARPGTPAVNGLTPALLTANPNAANPQRLDRGQALTCGPSNNYHNEQVAVHDGAMDNFVAGTGGSTTLAACLASVGNTAPVTGPQPNFDVMDVPVSDTGAAEQARCGLGPRLPFLLISPYAKPDYVSHTVIDQSSVVRFIEDNWDLPRLGNGAADATPGVGSITGMFDFDQRPLRPVFLDQATGEPVGHFTSPR